MVQERKIPAHRVVLAAASHFFNLMFTSKYFKVKYTYFFENEVGQDENMLFTLIFKGLKKVKRLRSGHGDDQSKETCPFISPKGPRSLSMETQIASTGMPRVFFLTSGGKAKK